MPAASASSPPSPAPFDSVDREALLCALVLAPATFPRNRFFALFAHPDGRRTRARAAQLRTIVRQLASSHGPRARLLDERLHPDGSAVLRYTIDELSFTRTAHLEPIELSAVRFALHRASGGRFALSPTDRSRVEGALARLSPEAALRL